MRTLALAFFWACAFGGIAWAAARWAKATVRRHVNDGLDPARYADLEFFAPKKREEPWAGHDWHEDEAL